MKDLSPLQEKTLSILLEHGKANPITGKTISGMINLKPRSSGKEGADMRSIIHALRVKGFPICATGDGYYYPQSSEELSAYITEFQGRVDNQQVALDAIKKAFDKIGYKVPPKPTYVTFVRRYESESKRGTFHYVDDKYGRITCTCDAYKFSTYAEKDCKHTKQYREEKIAGSMNKLI